LAETKLKETIVRHFISLFDVNQSELELILSIGERVKSLLAAGNRTPWLAQRVLALLFEKPSLRTRVSFEAGMHQLGGSAMFLGQEVGWQSRESTADFVHVLSQYVDFVVCRAKVHLTVDELASFNCVSVINGLTDLCHPCQALADLMTMREVYPSLAGKTVTFVGDGNNVARSLALGCAMVNMRFRLLGPPAYFMMQESVRDIKNAYAEADIVQSERAEVALEEADFVYTDVWTSMGQEAQAAKRRRDFAPFQLSWKLLSHAKPDCKILHCLPAKRGEEITDDVMDSPQSMVIAQAGNRMHAQKGLLLWLAMNQKMISPSDLKASGVEI
jgi:ornithine carbamoyltransferase